jgi:hypothetical protein
MITLKIRSFQGFQGRSREDLQNEVTGCFFPWQCPFLPHYILVDNWFNLVEKSFKTGLFLGVGLIKYPTFNRQFIQAIHV